jgi:hypothetical protein
VVLIAKSALVLGDYRGYHTNVIWPITDEGVAVGGVFGSGTAADLMPIAHLVAGVRSFR